MTATDIPVTMTGVYLTGYGDVDKLEYRSDIPVPTPGPEEVLIRVAAAGINNTDINTRTGWYARSVRDATDCAVLGADDGEHSSWSGAALTFPRIQGLDCCGQIVAVGEAIGAERIGERVVVRAMRDRHDPEHPLAFDTLGADMDGAFAQYVKTESMHALAVECDWTDIELATLPCAYATAEGMLTRAGVGAERVLVTGASGGVGSAAVQLAKRRGAEVVGVASAAKAHAVLNIGASRVVHRGKSLLAELGPQSVDVIVDLVGGNQWPELLDVLASGGRYVTSGAIAGPIVELDLRTLYLRDLTLLGSTHTSDEILHNVIRYVEAGEIRPLVAAIYPLADIAAAQQDFLAKHHIGNIVLIPPLA